MEENTAASPRSAHHDLFEIDPTLDAPDSNFTAGARLMTTELTERFKYREFLYHHTGTATPLFLISRGEEFEVFTPDRFSSTAR